VELPTYTSIWRIEKRLYKLYDFRLPMPLPVGQIAVFTAITVPYIVLLTIFGLPFNHTLFWLYVLPPGLLTWLATRPVLESKRLPELLISQARYLGEPATWCRMAPLAEKDEIVLFGRVWRRARAGRDLLEPAAEPLAISAPSAQPVTGQARRPPIAAASARAAGSAELARARRARAARPRGAPGPVGYPAGARGAVPAGYAEAAQHPGAAGQVPAWGAAVPVGYPEIAHELGREAPQRARGTERAEGVDRARERERARGIERARGTESAGHPGGRWDPTPAGPAPVWGSAAVPVGYPAVSLDPGPAGPVPAWGTAVPVGYPEVTRDPWPARPQQVRGAAGPAEAPAREPDPAGQGAQAPAGASGSTQAPAAADAGGSAQAPAAADASASTRAPAPRTMPPVLLVPAQPSVAGPPPARPAPVRAAPGVERILGRPGDQRGAGWRSHVTVVPGGRGPGRPDHDKEAKARAVLPLDGPRLVVVLGCTVGAGQTATALMLADLLASLRGEPVAALDLNPGPASLSELARIPATTVSTVLATRAPGAHAASPGHAAHPARSGGAARGSRARGHIDVICQDAAATASGSLTSLEHGRLIDVLASRYPLTLADPGASAVAKILTAADQLVLVAPASGDAAQAVSMTSEWLGAHGHAPLAADSIAVINGVSRRSVQHAEQAELVLRGRCRAIVRVPWDDHLAQPEDERGIRDSLEPGEPSRLARLHPAVLQAYTALAGLLVSALAAVPARGTDPPGTPRGPGGPVTSPRGLAGDPARPRAAR
jgi:MinD-like ATPase involved in chromosome partitioning or flagellar assembly